MQMYIHKASKIFVESRSCSIFKLIKVVSKFRVHKPSLWWMDGQTDALVEPGQYSSHFAIYKFKLFCFRSISVLFGVYGHAVLERT